MRLKRLAELVKRLNLGLPDLLDPAAQVLLGLIRIGECVEVVELQRPLVSAGGLQRLLEQLIEPVLLLG